MSHTNVSSINWVVIQKRIIITIHTVFCRRHKSSSWVSSNVSKMCVCSVYMGHIITAHTNHVFFLSLLVMHTVLTGHNVWLTQQSLSSLFLLFFLRLCSVFTQMKSSLKAIEQSYYFFILQPPHSFLGWCSCCVVFALWVVTPSLFFHLPCSSHAELTLQKAQWPFRCR